MLCRKICASLSSSSKGLVRSTKLFKYFDVIRGLDYSLACFTDSCISDCSSKSRSLLVTNGVIIFCQIAEFIHGLSCTILRHKCCDPALLFKLLFNNPLLPNEAVKFRELIRTTIVVRFESKLVVCMNVAK